MTITTNITIVCEYSTNHARYSVIIDLLYVLIGFYDEEKLPCAAYESC